MHPLTAYERAWRDVLDELRNCPDIRILEEHEGELTDDAESIEAALRDVEQRDGVVLDPALWDCHHRFSELGSCWSYGVTEEDEDGIFGGEFCLTPPLRVLQNKSPVERYRYLTRPGRVPCRGADHQGHLRLAVLVHGRVARGRRRT
jgi:hypothetical protein